MLWGCKLFICGNPLRACWCGRTTDWLFLCTGLLDLKTLHLWLPAPRVRVWECRRTGCFFMRPKCAPDDFVAANEHELLGRRGPCWQRPPSDKLRQKVPLFSSAVLRWTGRRLGFQRSSRPPGTRWTAVQAYAGRSLEAPSEA